MGAGGGGGAWWLRGGSVQVLSGSLEFCGLAGGWAASTQTGSAVLMLSGLGL